MPSRGSPVHMGKADRKPGPEAAVLDHRWKSQIMPEIDSTTKLPCLVLFLCLGCCTEEELPSFKPLNFGVSDSSFTSLNSMLIPGLSGTPANNRDPTTAGSSSPAPNVAYL